MIVAGFLIAAATLGGFPSCTVDNPLFCCTDSSDEFCSGKFTKCTVDPGRPFCDNKGEFPGSDDEPYTCVPDPHPELGTICDVATDCPAAHPTCIDQHCQGCGAAADCEPSAPVCSDTHACTGCVVEADCSTHTSTPHCGAGGACVACRDSGDCTDPSVPVCDTNGTCRTCQADAECPSEICDEGSGKCVPESEIVYVNGATGVTSLPCNKAAPCKTIQLGVDAVGGSRLLVHVAPGEYPDRVTITGKSLEISAFGVELAPLAGPGIDVKGSSTVLIEGIKIRNVGGTSGDGVRCLDDGSNAPKLTLVNVTITKNAGAAVNAAKCNLSLSGSSLVDNREGGVKLAASDFSVVNNVIVKNGSQSSSFGGVFIIERPPSGAAGARFEFNTVSENNAQVGSASGVMCGAVGEPLSLKNSIVFGNIGVGGQVDSGCAWTYSDIGPGGSIVAGTGNINMAPVFVNSLMNDYHLQLGSPGINAADPAATVDVDTDGDARPAGGRSDMGADEVL